MPTQSPKLLNQLRQVLRTKHYARRTEETSLYWTKRFIFFPNARHPQQMNTPEIDAFLTHLAVKDHVAASTQNQALAALLLLLVSTQPYACPTSSVCVLVACVT